MRISLRCLLAGLAFAGVAAAQEMSADSPPAGAVDGPRIHCAAPSYDFGEQFSTQLVEHTYSIENRGNATLLISKVHASCGCTVATVSSQSIPPGQTATVTARLNLKGRRGDQTKIITIESNDPKAGVYRLTLKGKSLIEIGLEPGYVNFGEVTGTNPVTKTVELLSRDPNIELVSVTGDTDTTQASIEADAEGKRRQIRVTALPPFTEGFHRGELTVLTTHPTQPKFKLPVSLLVPQPIHVVPQKLSIRGNYPGGLTRAMLVRAGTVRNFKVLGVDVPDGSITAEVVEAGQGNYRIIVRGIPTSPEINGKEVVVRTDVPGRENIRIPISFTGP